MKIEDKILINKYGQELVNINLLTENFKNLSLLEKRVFLKEIAFLILQSKPINNDVEDAIKISMLKSTFTPCVLLRKGIFENNLYKIIDLPESELLKCYILFLNLFKLAYLRRFYIEKNNPNKWWYWDLSDKDKCDYIIKLFGE